MVSVTTTLAFAPLQPSPLARTTSPFKDSSTPRSPTAKLWDEYERRALENARRRENINGSPQQPPYSRSPTGTLLDMMRSYDPDSSPKNPGVPPTTSATASLVMEHGLSVAAHSDMPPYYPAVATCKTCKESIKSSTGICEKCKKTIILGATSGESTPPLGPSCRNFASTDLPKLHKESASETTAPAMVSPKTRSRHTSSTPLADLPIRLSSLRPPPRSTHPTPPSYEPARPRKSSLTDPNEPFLRLHISRKPVPLPQTYHHSSPITPPSTSSSSPPSNNLHTRSPPLATIPALPHPAATATEYPRHASTTPSELSTWAPYANTNANTNANASPPPTPYASYNNNGQNTMSAWDEWDSDEEEKVGLAGYWRGRKWRGSRGSLGAASASASARRDSAGQEESGKEEGAARKRMRKRRNGFVRVISCGCGEGE